MVKFRNIRHSYFSREQTKLYAYLAQCLLQDGQGLIADLHPNKYCLHARVKNLVKAFLIDVTIVIG